MDKLKIMAELNVTVQPTQPASTSTRVSLGTEVQTMKPEYVGNKYQTSVNLGPTDPRIEASKLDTSNVGPNPSKLSVSNLQINAN